MVSLCNKSSKSEFWLPCTFEARLSTILYDLCDWQTFFVPQTNVISLLKGKSRMIDHALTYPSCRAGF